jgi:hypothetical protein
VNEKVSKDVLEAVSRKCNDGLDMVGEKEI